MTSETRKQTFRSDEEGNPAAFFHQRKHVIERGRVKVAQTKQVTAVIIVLIVIITLEITLHILHYINCKYTIAANIYLKNCLFEVYNCKYPA